MRVYRTVFDLRFQRLLYRCNLLAPDCVRWLHVTSSARIAILDLVLWTIFYPINCILFTFPMTVVVHFFWGIVESSRGSSSSESPPKGLSSVKKTVSRLLSLSFPPGISPFSRIDWMLMEEPSGNIVFPIVRNSNVLHQFNVNWFSARVSLNCSRVSQGILWILAVLESCLAASFTSKSKPLLSLRNLMLHVLKTLPPVLALSCPRKCSVVGMVPCVKKDAWLGEMQRVSAQVSWTLVFDCPKQVSPPSAFWSSVSNSALDLSSALGIWTSSTNRLFLVEIITWDVRCLPLGDRIAISSPYWTRIFTIWTSTTGPIIVPPGIAEKALDNGFSRESVYSRHNGMICPKPSSSSSRIL